MQHKVVQKNESRKTKRHTVDAKGETTENYILKPITDVK